MDLVCGVVGTPEATDAESRHPSGTGSAFLHFIAVAEGFEPSEDLRPHTLSSGVSRGSPMFVGVRSWPFSISETAMNVLERR